MRLGLFVLAALVSCGQGAPRPDEVATSRQAITGGAPDATNSGTVALRRGAAADDLLLIETCSASLIAPNVVLTARHCVEAMSVPSGCDGTFTGVRTDAYNAIETEGDLSTATVKYVVSQIRVPTGVAMCDDDIAVLILETNVPDDVLTPIQPRIASPPVTGESYAAIGYGGTSAASDAPDGLRRKRTGLSVFCVGSACGSDAFWEGAPAGTCGGDSGGPAIDASGNVFGVAIRGDACVAPTEPTVYTRTDWHADLIVNTVLDGAVAGSYAAPAWAVLPPPIDGGAPADASADAKAKDDAAAAPDDASIANGDDDASPSATEATTTTSTGCAIGKRPAVSPSYVAIAIALLLMQRRARSRASRSAPKHAA